MSETPADVMFTLNDRPVSAPDDGTPLLYVLRERFDVHSPRYGCGLGQCGTCAVLVDGEPVRSCIAPLASVHGRNVVSLEGLGLHGRHPVQQAFIDEQAMQCGYCASGMILAAVALLDADPDPNEAAIRNALDSYLCRCGSHARIVRAVRRAADWLKATSA